ncbi:MATE family efflux transporter [Lactobacillus delbrueckii]|uniref:MATE family efflux transporter n=1 Tax=Lactobacillus delbrueckii TaxID=1584 RepID=UPI001E5CFD35|nr:MATE family efflux transporter [Lactobacillus delbrueckii]MCD5532697.1 hypothetical protein [Lactobacillus delbrueckii subsp. lactis]
MTEELKKKVWAFSLPMISELFVQQLYSVIDIAIIGRYLGAKELGAVGNAAHIIMLFLVASGGFEMAVDVMVSRLLGAGKNKEKVAMARDTLFLSAISGLVLVVIAWISMPALFIRQCLYRKTWWGMPSYMAGSTSLPCRSSTSMTLAGLS